ncbi:DUF3889 domain-containing protein [Cytobacillus sp. FSL W7-1323]|uniref:DUF3889 domain-containing protein n=1 Tax=Cytobacillus kochii TaxID=859143 RepID=A0A248TN32_9BACI|nr:MULTISPECIES: DUF3889 domain-containing protein [Cytobacillus]ASV69562.1 hypothetical protein CKF48_20965 [Cytobacillus kochii]MDQ0184346.1 hypothetical protein [Cytobacillus kochii]MEA1852479.1 DUF3889 domain-containing protein [Cytobacillus sp. OWB-43]MED1604647.1 DUF3889 domain-containing protein [Cytobacillus kochii]
MEKRVFLSIVIVLFSYIFISSPQTSFAVYDAPSYAKWGKEAMMIAKEKYPSADIVDYQHLGKEVKDETEIEKFKLWMRQQEIEYGLYVFIEYDKDSEKIVRILTKKTDR